MNAKKDKTQPIPNRTPPHDESIEAGLLGGILSGNVTDGDRMVLDEIFDSLQATEFYSTRHMQIFDAARKVYEKSGKVDLVLVTSALKAAGTLDAIGGVTYLSQLIDLMPSLASGSVYAREVQELATRRRVISTLVSLAEQGYSYGDIETYLDTTERSLLAITDAGQRRETKYETVCADIKNVLNEIEDIHQRNLSLTGVPSGLPDLDRITKGFQPTDFVVIAGRTSMGKTTLATEVTRHITLMPDPVGVAYFSLEMSKKQLLKRILSSHSGVDHDKLRSADRPMTDTDRRRITDAAVSLYGAPLYIVDRVFDIFTIRSVARRMVKEHGVGIIFIDNLQQVVPSSKAERRDLDLGEITGLLKQLAKELDIPVVALSQLNRAPDARPDKRPTLSDLRESGAIEQDADVVMLLYRDDYYNRAEDNPNKGVAEINIAKQRNGETRVVRVAFIDSCVAFRSIYND